VTVVQLGTVSGIELEFWLECSLGLKTAQSLVLVSECAMEHLSDMQMGLALGLASAVPMVQLWYLRTKE
jgi:protein-arginine kinase